MIKLKYYYPLFLLHALIFNFLLLSCDDTENEQLPVITSKHLEIEIKENPQAGTMLGKIEATTDIGTISFSLLSETVSGAFLVTEIGEIIVKDASKFDAELNKFLKCEVLLQNKAARDTVEVLIDLINVTEFLEVENAEVSIEENSPENTLITDLSEYITSDGQSFSYQIISLSVPNSILIEEDGKVFVDSKLLFDFEAVPQIVVAIKVKSGTFEKTLILKIDVTNVFDTPITLLKDLINIKNSKYSLYSGDPNNYNIGFFFKSNAEQTFVKSLGCSPTKDGLYTVTLYDALTQQVLVTTEVNVQGADPSNIKFFYTELPQKILLLKNKEYAVAYYQEKAISFFRILPGDLSLPSELSGITLIKGAYGSNNNFPSMSSAKNHVYTVDLELTPF